MTISEILNKIKGFFVKTKNKIETAKLNIEIFCAEHKSSIKALMNVWQKLYIKADGSQKMEATVKTIFNCLGLSAFGSEYADDITAFIEEKCQAIYDELVSENGLSKVEA